MQHDVRQGHIAFLLSLGTAALGCDFDDAGTRCATPHEQADDDDGDGDGEGDDEGEAESGAGETGGGTTGDPSTTAGTGTDPSAGSEGGTDPGETGTTGTAEPPICQPYVDHYIECFPAGDAEVLLEGCIYSVNAGHAHSPECGSAVEDWYACLIATPCEVVLGGEPFCEAERAALDGTCPSMDDTTGE